MKVKRENLAAKLNRLFKEKKKPDGTQYTQTEVVEGSDGILTRVYLWKLRTGRATNPGLHVIQYLAEFFGVGLSYFSVGEKGKMAHTKVSQERDKLVNQIALRSSKLDDNGKQVVLNMIESILKTKK